MKKVNPIRRKPIMPGILKPIRAFLLPKYCSGKLTKTLLNGATNVGSEACKGKKNLIDNLVQHWIPSDITYRSSSNPFLTIQNKLESRHQNYLHHSTSCSAMESPVSSNLESYPNRKRPTKLLTKPKASKWFLN